MSEEPSVSEIAATVAAEEIAKLLVQRSRSRYAWPYGRTFRVVYPAMEVDRATGHAVEFEWVISIVEMGIKPRDNRKCASVSIQVVDGLLMVALALTTPERWSNQNPETHRLSELLADPECFEKLAVKIWHNIV